MNSTSIFNAVDYIDLISVFGIILTFITLIVAIRALLATEKGLKVTNHTLLLSIYLQKRKDLSDSLTYFYYPLDEFLNVYWYNHFFVHQKPVKPLPPKREKDYQHELDFEVRRHISLGDPEIVKMWMELGNSTKDTKEYIEILMLKTNDIKKHIEDRIDELTKKIEDLGGEWLL